MNSVKPAWRTGARHGHTGARHVHTGARHVRTGARAVHTGARRVHTGAKAVRAGIRRRARRTVEDGQSCPSPREHTPRVPFVWIHGLTDRIVRPPHILSLTAAAAAITRPVQRRLDLSSSSS